ncbi:hypothetical protein BXZ70DRAFT_211650 [Cristinia sonorae]|uniref:Secreted protein n=1 Tax=Cristinia sonorae TaxID=1940300 RepID=A0A8K0XP47_9AGAR|nr:hypothetical protein BXZ70DRAFT_211650 [Cristinia sonorae]
MVPFVFFPSLLFVFLSPSFYENRRDKHRFCATAHAKEQDGVVRTWTKEKKKGFITTSSFPTKTGSPFLPILTVLKPNRTAETQKHSKHPSPVQHGPNGSTGRRGLTHHHHRVHLRSSPDIPIPELLPFASSDFCIILRKNPRLPPTSSFPYHASEVPHAEPLFPSLCFPVFCMAPLITAQGPPVPPKFEGPLTGIT